jgi:hypothetical protein
MVWCHQRKVIFVHIPKTAGSSVESVLGCFNNPHKGYGIEKGKAKQHYSWREYESALGPESFANYTKFTIVRHPYTRFISEYYYCYIPGMGHKNGQSIDEFIDSCEKIVNNRSFGTSIHHDHFIPQWEFIYDERGNLKVDQLFYFEDLSAIKDFLATIVSPCKLPHILKKQGNKLSLTPAQKERIYKLYQKDFEMLGYDKDDDSKSGDKC